MTAETTDADRVRALYVDRDAAAREAVRDTVGSEYPELAVALESDAEAALDRLGEVSFDCLIVGGDVGDGFDRLVDAAGTPVVLFARPAATADPLRERSDTFVEKDNGERGRRLLAEKVLSVVAASEAEGDSQASALERVAGERGVTARFLLAADGSVRWASHAFASVFPVGDGDRAAPDAALYERIGPLLEDADAEALARGVEATDPRPVTATAGGETRHYLHAEHRLEGVEGADRLAVFEDVTAAVERAERRGVLELLVENARDGLFHLDENGVVSYCNDSFASMLGYDLEGIVGTHASEHMSDAEFQRAQRLLERTLRQGRRGYPLDLTLRDVDGDPVEASIHITVLTSDGRYEGQVGVARDVTERKRRERELRRYRRLVESAGDPMLAFDADWHLELCNEAVADLLDRSKTTLRGRPVEALLPGAAAASLREAASDLDPDGWATCDVRVPDAEGDERVFEVTLGSLRGEVGGTVATLHDVTERERRADELDLLKQVLTRVLRHDVRSGLTVIRGQAEVLADRLSDDDAKVAETIIDRSESMVETTEKARAIERVLESDEGRTTVDLRTVVNRSVANVAAANPDAEYDVRITDRLPVVAHHALPYAVEDVVENAVVHSDAETPQVVVDAEMGGDRVELAVRDNGPGIPEEALEVIERGEETPLKHGQGVGLWLVNWVVDRSGGDLSFVTDDATTVLIRLDRGEAAALTDDDPPPAGTRSPDLDELSVPRPRERADDADGATGTDEGTDREASADAGPVDGDPEPDGHSDAR